MLALVIGLVMAAWLLIYSAVKGISPAEEIKAVFK
jgi:hypothetical protein